MKISRADVEKIATLARLSLTEDEIERYRNQLSTVLTYIAKLDEVKTEGVPTTAQVTGLTNALADDAIVPSPPVDESLANAPLRDGDSIKVKAVFDES